MDKWLPGCLDGFLVGLFLFLLFGANVVQNANLLQNWTYIQGVNDVPAAIQPLLWLLLVDLTIFGQKLICIQY